MWLLDVDDYTLRQFINPQDVHLGGYAILSHTWGDGEVSFDDIQCLDVARARPAWDKVQQTCRVAEERGFAFVWIDTCCIDKRSSAELSEAINSMFAWYRAAAECYVYLADLGGDDGNQFYLYGDENKPFPDIRKCRWFTRGWTLQELIAPKFMYFYDRTWTQRGSKKSLSELLTRITNIDKETLFDPERLYSLPVARRMSWAATRQTTRPEDMSYCLFGIFGVNMPLLYGEGANAFLRLQEAIALTTEDLSLFAWDDPAGSVAPPYSGILAHSPAQFRHCHRLHNIEDPLQSGFRPFSMVNHCFSFQTSLLTDTENGQYLMPLHCRKNPEDFHSSFTIALELIKTATGFVRHERTIIPSNFNITHPTSWDPVPRTVTIPKVLRETDLLRIRHQSDNAFNFMVSISGEWAHKLSATVPDLSEEAPSGTGWDSSTGRYLTNNSPLFTGLLTGTIYENRAFFSEKYAQFLLFFGFAGGYTKDLGLFSGPDREYIQEPWIALSRSDGNSPIETFNPKSTHVFDLPGNVLAQQHRMHYLRFTSYAGHFYRQELKLTQEEDWSNAGERTRLGGSENDWPEEGGRVTSSGLQLRTGLPYAALDIAILARLETLYTGSYVTHRVHITIQRMSDMPKPQQRVVHVLDANGQWQASSEYHELPGCSDSDDTEPPSASSPEGSPTPPLGSRSLHSSQSVYSSLALAPTSPVSPPALTSTSTSATQSTPASDKHAPCCGG